jgi:arylsulfatase A-like enzyme
MLNACLAVAAEEKPNILWITGEDMSAKWLGCYGNERIKTPNFDKFAQDGFLYTRCFAHSPVCAPARSGWITGIHPVSAGTIYMRSQNELPASLIWYPDALRANGYFTANSTKTDYNTSNRKVGGFGGGKSEGTVGNYVNTWDSYEDTAWKNPNRKPNQPFFQVDNSAGCHESYLHKDKETNEDFAPAAMKLAPYHPDIPEMRLDYARYTAGVMKADKVFGNILARLEADGLADDTIVIFTSDNGGVIGRSKRFLFDSGTRVAFMVRIPEKFKHLRPAEKPGTRIDRLISFIDMPKTWLAITKSAIPPQMQGNVFLGKKQDPPREHVFLARERMDEVPDMQRALRDDSYLYIRKFIPPDELWPPGPSWGYHWADLDVLRSLNFQVFGDERTGSLEDFVAASQIAQGTIFQYGIEHQRRRKPKSSAIAICHFITFAPDFKWGIVDHFQTPKRSFDFVKRAYQPLLVSLQFDKRRWLPAETFTGKFWFVNDLSRAFSNCTLNVTIHNARGKQVLRKSRAINFIAADSSAAVAGVDWKVTGRVGETFRVALSLETADRRIVSSNYYDLLIGDQDKARKDCTELAAEFRAIKDEFHPADYYRFYPGLTGPSAANRVGDQPPAADLRQLNSSKP